MLNPPSPQGQPVTEEDIALVQAALDGANIWFTKATLTRILAALRGSGQTSEGERTDTARCLEGFKVLEDARVPQNEIWIPSTHDAARRFAEAIDLWNVARSVTPPTEDTRMTNEYTTEYITPLHSNPVWKAIWRTIKGWDISRHNDGLYSGPTGDDATRIFEAVTTAMPVTPLAIRTVLRDLLAENAHNFTGDVAFTEDSIARLDAAFRPILLIEAAKALENPATPPAPSEEGTL